MEGLAFPVPFGLGYLFLLPVLYIIFRNKKTSITRFGLLASIITIYYSAMCNVYLLTFNTSSILFPGTVIIFIFTFILTIYGFFISIAREPILKSSFFEES